MLTITQLGDGRIAIKANYFYSHRIRKAVLSAVFDYEDKKYIIEKKYLPMLECAFPGEIYYKTPRWVIYGQPMPDLTEMYKIQDKSITVPELKLSPYDYQNYGIRFMVDKINQNGFVLNADDVGLGKCHGAGTEILMYDGSVKRVEDIQEGELLMGDNSTPRTVLSTTTGREQMYKITLSNGDSYTCNESHILSLKYKKKYLSHQKDDVIDICLRDYLQLPDAHKSALVSYKKPVSKYENTRPCKKDLKDVAKYGKSVILKGYEIPPSLKLGDKKTRLALLQGMLNTDNLFQKDRHTLTTTLQIAKEVAFISKSLGFYTTVLPYKKQYTVIIELKENIYDFTVTLLGEGRYYGFTLDGNHRYLLGDFTVTHNTIQTIGAMKWFIENQNIKKILIICKKTIKKQWQDEINKFTDLNDTYYIDWTQELKKKRIKVYDAMKEHDRCIMITNYHSFLNDTELIKDIGFEFVILDEIHTAKCRTGVINNHIAEVCKGKKTIFLTGTPIMSKPEDMYGIVQITNPNYFGNWNAFSDRFLTIDEFSVYGPTVVGARHLDELRDKIQNILIRRTEYEVSIELPKTVIKDTLCPLDNTQQTLFNELADYSDELNVKMQDLVDPETKEVPPERLDDYTKLASLSKGLIALRQGVSSDPRMLIRSQSKMAQKFSASIPSSYKMSSKTEMTLEIIEDIITSDHKLIIFSKYRTSAVMLAEDIKKKFKYDVLLYTGAENEEERNHAKDLFWNTDNHNILIGTDAMAEGVNLQCAKYVINYDLPDTAAIYTQRIGRIRRASSEYGNIICYNMISEDSKDVERMENIRRNMDMTDALVNIDEAQRTALINAMKEGA